VRVEFRGPMRGGQRRSSAHHSCSFATDTWARLGVPCFFNNAELTAKDRLVCCFRKEGEPKARMVMGMDELAGEFEVRRSEGYPASRIRRKRTSGLFGCVDVEVRGCRDVLCCQK